MSDRTMVHTPTCFSEDYKLDAGVVVTATTVATVDAGRYLFVSPECVVVAPVTEVEVIPRE